MSIEAPPRRRPNGRSARIRQDVHRTVVDLLHDRSIDDLTIALVAEHSGVHQATIYRRWGSIPALVADIVTAGPARTSPLPDTGTLLGDLRAYAVGVADTLSGPLGLLLLRAAVSNLPPQDHAQPSAILRERAEQLQDMLDRASARGENPPAVDELLEIVVAPLYFRALFGYPAGAQDARRLVDRLLAPHARNRPGATRAQITHP